MRWFKLTFSSLILTLVLCAPALAQSSPAASQYDPVGSGDCPTAPGTACAQSVVGSIEDFADNVGGGTDAMNEAMKSPVASASAPDASPSPGAGAAKDIATADEGLASITELPETGGAPPVALGTGVLLVALGLMAHRAAGR